MAKLNVRNRNKGQFYKNGKPKPANWEYRFETAKIDGKRTSVSKAGFSTKAQAQSAGIAAMASYENAGLAFKPSDISVSDYFDYWIKNYCLVNISDSTLTGYRNIINNHLKPRIGQYKLKSITTLILQEMINDIYVTHGFTKNFMKNILKVLKGSFRYAKVTAKLITDNPAEDVVLPTISNNHKKDDDLIILTKDKIKTILDRFQKSPSTYYAILTAYYTGFRVSEVYGLTWDCIDFENKTITINKISKKIEKDGKYSDGKVKRGIRGKATTRWYFGSCKTPSSYRTINVGDSLLAALKEYKEWQEANEIRYNEYYTKHYLKEEITETNHKVFRIIHIQDNGIDIPYTRTFPVFIKENGEYHGSDPIKYASKVINYELGINFNFHALRHTHATMLIEAGIPVKAVSERLGHGNVRTTLETYVHVTKTMREDAANKFEEFGSLETSGTIINFCDQKRNRTAAAQ